MNASLPSVDEAGLARALASGPTLLEIGAPWCTACKALAATLRQMAPFLEPRVRWVYLDSEAFPGTAAKYGVMALPTLLLFREGKVVDRRVGALGRANLESFLGGP
ncbi:thioredoxin family protein [Mesoterricola silvestris]|uniref:Thioredoxin n=1 Tax=Mesoterricola silvestris TaxID=2927979 RepID=A0AA48GMT6_9BACT|nr:thioredoxin family protein [Mesoterricola silvestris]BDU74307.1 thioredoxin [Mesoterricola silvestris]